MVIGCHNLLSEPIYRRKRVTREYENVATTGWAIDFAVAERVTCSLVGTHIQYISTQKRWTLAAAAAGVLSP
jgi:hypothetical protein